MNIEVGRVREVNQHLFHSVVQNGTKKRTLAASLVIALIVLPEPTTTVLGMILVCIWWLLEGKQSRV
jgi:hypothetical protein